MNNRKETYNKQGLYNGYDKNNKERDALDYYSTPTEEVLNILRTLNKDFSNYTILEPCAGGGHMLNGILDFIWENGQDPSFIFATDIKDRGCSKVDFGKEYDFLSDNYPYTENIDYIIMNPPYSVIEPFTMRALGIAKKGVLMLGRLQFLEGEKRYKSILKDCPPSDVYIYVDRIMCYKNGDTTGKKDSAQAYAWFYWNLEREDSYDTKIHWIRKMDKKGN